MSLTAWEKESLVSGSRYARVFSPSNIALSKYWGKRDIDLNLPTNGSLSVTLKGYGSFTTVEFDESFSADRLVLNGIEEHPAKISKIVRVLDELRGLASVTTRARVQSWNNFPTAAGLASSASGLSAVCLAAANALGLQLPKKKLSEISRKGSGSACRSLFGGYVEWRRGELADGTDSVGEQLVPAEHWPLRVLIAVANKAKKNHASTGGMEHTRLTSPYFNAWVESAQKQLGEIRGAVRNRDFAQLAELTESNCIRMHASAMAAYPPVMYWQAETFELMARVRALRDNGVPAFFTIDAGPNVVVLCEPRFASQVSNELLGVAGVSLLSTEIGDGSRPFVTNEWQGEP